MSGLIIYCLDSGPCFFAKHFCLIHISSTFSKLDNTNNSMGLQPDARRRAIDRSYKSSEFIYLSIVSRISSRYITIVLRFLSYIFFI